MCKNFPLKFRWGAGYLDRSTKKSFRCSLLLTEIFSTHFGHAPVDEIFGLVLKTFGSGYSTSPISKEIIRDMLMTLIPDQDTKERYLYVIHTNVPLGYTFSF